MKKRILEKKFNIFFSDVLYQKSNARLGSVIHAIEIFYMHNFLELNSPILGSFIHKTIPGVTRKKWGKNKAGNGKQKKSITENVKEMVIKVKN